MDRSKSGTKEKAIGILDGVFTIAIVAVIFCCVIYPKAFGKSSMEKLFVNRDEFASRSDTLNNSLLQTTSKNEEKELNGADFAVLIIAVIFGLISVLAALTLFMSTNLKNGPERKLQMTRYWMHCNLFTITMTVIELFAVVLILERPARIAIPILGYIGFRVVATFIVRQSLRIMSPPLVATLDPIELEEKRTRLKQFGKMSYYQRRMQPECRATLQSPTLKLAPYRGEGISLPSCQCIAPEKN